MHRLHHQVIRPMVEAVEATEIMEIGSAQGSHTALLQQYCREVGAISHSSIRS